MSAMEPSPTPGPSGVARAEQRLADAVEEFDAAVAAGQPLAVLVVRDHEVQLAATALSAARVETTAPVGLAAV